MKTLVAILLLGLAYEVASDCYMHNMRGSNNRLDEANRDRANANRVFDSQNNNRGGYNVGQSYFYTGSIMPLEWYQNCKQRSRNKGLYTANQQLNKNSAQSTRQNPNGDRRGYECPEERDYYPYWHPTPWVDVAVLTNNGQRCAAYQAESQNVKSRWYCQAPAGWIAEKVAQGQNGFIPITQEGCEGIDFTEAGVPLHGTWMEQEAWGVDPPLCRENQITRENHHGNTLGGAPAGFNWTLPADFISESCALRVRYNISTGDYSTWESLTSIQSGTENRSTSYTGNQNNPGRFPAKTKIWETYGLTYAAVQDCFNDNKNGDQAQLKACREYIFKNNPKVDIFGKSLMVNTETTQSVKLQLAINTNQFGRTFQDRSFRFAVRQRPAGTTGPIYNVNVAGKRGNIVQTYPGHEYFFRPEHLEIKRGDWIHFQWTGSNTNPDNNAGQGKQGTDRHNVISLRGPTYLIAGQDTGNGPYSPTNALPTYGHWARSYPSRVDASGISFLGFSQQDRETLAILYDKTSNNGQFGGEKSELDDAGTYFDMGPRVVTQNGNYHYMSTRNNNFSNRGQKALIVVSDNAGAYAHFGFNEAAHSVGGTTVWAGTGAFNTLQTLSIVESPRSGSSLDDKYAASPLVYVAPAFMKDSVGGAPPDYNFGSTQPLVISISYEAKAGEPWYKAQAYATEDPAGAWRTIDASFDNGVATISTSSGGYFAVQNQPNFAALILIPLVIVLAVAIASFIFWKKCGARACGNRCSSVGSTTVVTPKDGGPRRANV